VTNPYAPPVTASFVLPVAALPEGMRRYRLAEKPYRTLVRRALLVRFAWVLAIYLVLFGVLELIGIHSVLLLPIFGLSFGLNVLSTWLRTRAATRKQLVMYELIVGPRVARRIMLALPPSEILRPEVTRILETPRGMWLISTAPRRTLALSAATEGYAELRATMGTWGQVESMRGWAAFAFAWGQRRHMLPRDAIAGTTLEADASLRDELMAVRALSADRGAGYDPLVRTRDRLVRMVILWAVLVVLFLVIWQMLQPQPRPRAPRPRPPITGP
jgi:hypothetical protein